MRAEDVALVPICVECAERWLPGDDSRWRLYEAGDDLDEPAELVWLCASCAVAEFD